MAGGIADGGGEIAEIACRIGGDAAGRAGIALTPQGRGEFLPRRRPMPVEQPPDPGHETQKSESRPGSPLHEASTQIGVILQTCGRRA
jgi:hypothetical protein